MDENDIDRMAEDVFRDFEDAAQPLSLDDALSLAEALETRCSNYADGIRDDLRRGRR
jgi:hypothetical protein